MARKATRLLSLLLSILLMVSMISVVAVADYEYDEAAVTKNYYNIPYDKLAGKANEGTGLYNKTYVVNAAWEFEPNNVPKTVSYHFRGAEVTETYDPTRHLTTVKKMFTQAAADGVDLPYCILTAGNYTETISLSNSVILLGAQAGINPNVVDDDPTAEWELNPQRYLPDMKSIENRNETRIWAGVDLCETERVLGNTLKLFQIASSSNASRVYVVDGLLFQGYGASFYDANAGSGTRTYYVQNVIMNDNSAYDVSPIRLWGRGASTTVKKQMHFCNSYVTGNNAMYFYSGHATKLHINGVSYQNSSQSFIYNVMTMQWVGMDFAMTNCHLWNSETTAVNDLSSSFVAARFPYTSTSYAEAGTNTEPFYYDISNNTICNMTTLKGDGTLGSTQAPFLFYMAGENEMIKFEDNIIMTTADLNEGQMLSPIEIRYNKLADGTISRASAESVSYTTTADYEISDRNLSIKNNIFTEAYWKTININTNRSEATLIENEGNLYTEKYDAENVMIGVIPERTDANNYDKWVWLEYDLDGENTDPTKKSSYVNTEAIKINGEAKEQTISVDVASDIATYDISMTCDSTVDEIAKLPLNTVGISKADASFNKLEEIALDANNAAVLGTEDRQNYYVLSVYSIDKRSSYDFHLTINRAIKQGAVLSGIVDEASKTEAQDKTVDYFNYEVNYENKTFDFTLNVPAGATAALTDVNGEPVVAVDTNTFSIPLTDVVTKYEFDVVVTNTDGSEKYDLSLLRRMNERTVLSNVRSDSGAVAQSGNTWTVTLDPYTLATDFAVDLSEYATIRILDPVYGTPLTAKNGKYSLTNIAAGKTAYAATVTAQNGVNTQAWTLVVDRPARSDAELFSIKNAKLSGGVYTASITGNRFMVSPNYSDSATVALYSDAACTQKIINANLTLTALTTNVWVKVTAEDGETNTVTKLVITTSNLSAEEGVYYAPMGDNGIISVSGATAFDDKNVTVQLPDDTKQFNFKVNGLNGHRVRVYTDSTKTLMTSSEQILTLDSGVTKLYVDAIKGTETVSYVIDIVASQYYSFNDKATEWAKAYVENLGTSGLAIMKGDNNGNFNGANNLTRYEMAIMMVRMTGANKDLYAKTALTFLDAEDVPAWAVDYLKAAQRMGLIGGYGVTDESDTLIGYEFKGGNKATRSEFLRVMMNAVVGNVEEYYEDNKEAIDKKVEGKKFADIETVDDWAIPAVHTAIYKDVVKGDAEKMINPSDLITRNEVATILGRYLSGMN